MENKINEAYIANLSKYMHLLSINEIFDEIKKLKAFINTLRLDGYHKRNKINTDKISKKKMIEIIINDRATIHANNDIDMLAVDVNKLNVYNK